VTTQVLGTGGIGQEMARQLKIFALWLGVSILAVPLVLLIHELGHLLTAIALGFHHVRLHYESVSYADQDLFWRLIQSGAKAQAAALAPFWKVAVMEIAGPLVSIATLFVAARYVRRFWIAAVVGTVAIWRFVAPLLFVWVNFRLARHGMVPMQHIGMDEFDFWMVTGVSVRTTLCIELGLIMFGLVQIERAMQRGIRVAASGAMGCGMLIGVPLYYAIGPHLLP
jgi:hypothetical protein